MADQLYEEARRHAVQAGFTNVDEYVADVIAQDLELLDHLFTPAVIQELDRVSAAAKTGGKTYSPEEVKEHFRERSESWREKHGEC